MVDYAYYFMIYWNVRHAHLQEVGPMQILT